MFSVDVSDITLRDAYIALGWQPEQLHRKTDQPDCWRLTWPDQAEPPKYPFSAERQLLQATIQTPHK